MPALANQRHEHGRDYFAQFLSYDPETGIFRWKVGRGGEPAGEIAGTLRDGYVIIGVNYKWYRAHRLAWLFLTGEWPKGNIDHHNLNRADNRAKNLRMATRSQNEQNKPLRKDNKTGFKGVWFDKSRNKYHASIRINKKTIHLKRYNTAEEAYEAYCKAADEMFGEYARFE